ncbi:hypothetical protein Dimus_009241 [Dionaea muscipula]
MVSNSGDAVSFDGSLSYSVRQGYNALVGRVAKVPWTKLVWSTEILSSFTRETADPLLKKLRLQWPRWDWRLVGEGDAWKNGACSRSQEMVGGHDLWHLA